MTELDEAFAPTDDPDRYSVTRDVSSREILDKARAIIGERFSRGEQLRSAIEVRQYLQVALAALEQEVFACIFLDNRHRVIQFEKLFFGTIDGTSVYPREIVRRCLDHNAAAVILTHNHPSGVPEPSTADKHITKRITRALNLIDVRVLDHIVVGAEASVSFSERGML
ncbi:MAG: DNA repair protein RadC [Pseudomonadota bacterium]